MAGPQQKFFVLPTAEVRWFFRGTVPKEISKWFNEQGNKPESQISRIDYYLQIMDSNSLGVKLREGRIEIKQRQEHQPIIQLSEHATGCLEHWCKWSFMVSDTSIINKILKSYPPFWTGVKKERLIFMYHVTANDKVIELSCHSPKYRTKIKSHKCGFELAKVIEENSGKKWWSLGFEAFGNDTDLNNNLLLVSKKILSTKGTPGLNTENSYGYPRWLQIINSKSK